MTQPDSNYRHLCIFTEELANGIEKTHNFAAVWMTQTSRALFKTKEQLRSNER